MDVSFPQHPLAPDPGSQLSDPGSTGLGQNQLSPHVPWSRFCKSLCMKELLGCWTPLLLPLFLLLPCPSGGPEPSLLSGQKSQEETQKLSCKKQVTLGGGGERGQSCLPVLFLIPLSGKKENLRSDFRAFDT